jgi:hypothetical protein
MARRRYLSTDISTDVAVNRLATNAGDFAALLYTWMIPHAGDNGQLPGDPEQLMFIVCPGRRDKQPDDIREALAAMEDLGLISWDIENGIVEFPESFYKHQTYITEKRRTDAHKSAPSKPQPHEPERSDPPAQNSADQRTSENIAGNGALFSSSLSSLSSLSSSVSVSDVPAEPATHASPPQPDPPEPLEPDRPLTPSRTPKQLAADIAFQRRKGLYDAWCRGIGLDPDGDESAVGRDVAFRNLKPIVPEASPSIQDFEACTAYLVSQDWRTDPPSIPQVIQGFAAWVSKDRPEKAESKVSQISSRQGQSRYETPAERNAKSFDAYRAELRDQIPNPSDDPNVIDVKVSGS